MEVFIGVVIALGIITATVAFSFWRTNKTELQLDESSSSLGRNGYEGGHQSNYDCFNGDGNSHGGCD